MGRFLSTLPMNDTISSANAGYVQVVGIQRPFQEDNGWISHESLPKVKPPKPGSEGKLLPNVSMGRLELCRAQGSIQIHRLECLTYHRHRGEWISEFHFFSKFFVLFSR